MRPRETTTGSSTARVRETVVADARLRLAVS